MGFYLLLVLLMNIIEPSPVLIHFHRRSILYSFGGRKNPLPSSRPPAAHAAIMRPPIQEINVREFLIILACIVPSCRWATCSSDTPQLEWALRLIIPHTGTRQRPEILRRSARRTQPDPPLACIFPWASAPSSRHVLMGAPLNQYLRPADEDKGTFRATMERSGS